MKITVENEDHTVELEEYLCRKLSEGGSTIHGTIQQDEREILYIGRGCICITIACPTIHSVRDLKQKCDSGELASDYQQALITDELKERFGLKDLKLHLEIPEWEYNFCLSELGQGKIYV